MPSTTNSPTSSVTAESRSTAPSCQRRSATLQQPRLRPFPAAQTGALHLLNILATACRASPVPISVLATMRRTESVVCLAVAGRHTRICAPVKFCVAGSVCWTHQALLPAVRSKEAGIKWLQAKTGQCHTGRENRLLQEANDTVCSCTPNRLVSRQILGHCLTP